MPSYFICSPLLGSTGNEPTPCSLLIARIRCSMKCLNETFKCDSKCKELMYQLVLQRFGHFNPLQELIMLALREEDLDPEGSENDDLKEKIAQEAIMQPQDSGEVDLFACPVCFEPLVRKGPPGFNLPAIYRSGFKCLKCNKSYSSRNIYLDLTVLNDDVVCF